MVRKSTRQGIMGSLLPSSELKAAGRVAPGLPAEYLPTTPITTRVGPQAYCSTLVPLLNARHPSSDDEDTNYGTSTART